MKSQDEVKNWTVGFVLINNSNAFFMFPFKLAEGCENQCTTITS